MGKWVGRVEDGWVSGWVCLRMGGLVGGYV